MKPSRILLALPFTALAISGFALAGATLVALGAAQWCERRMR